MSLEDTRAGKYSKDIAYSRFYARAERWCIEMCFHSEMRVEASKRIHATSRRIYPCQDRSSLELSVITNFVEKDAVQIRRLDPANEIPI